MHINIRNTITEFGIIASVITTMIGIIKPDHPIGWFVVAFACGFGTAFYRVLSME